jgi:cytosine/uracil/thiamine/allantoin permease
MKYFTSLLYALLISIMLKVIILKYQVSSISDFLEWDLVVVCALFFGIIWYYRSVKVKSKEEEISDSE